MDEDLERLTREELLAQVKKLRHGIRNHRDSDRHELCWHHPELWGLLPEKTDPLPTVPARACNLGAQVFRENRDDVARFTTISYWAARDDIRAYAGEDIEKTHHLPRDAEYLLELPPHVRHFDILVNDWGG